MSVVMRRGTCEGVGIGKSQNEHALLIWDSAVGAEIQHHVNLSKICMT